MDLETRLKTQDEQIRALQLLVFALLHNAARLNPAVVRALRKGLDVEVPQNNPEKAGFAEAVLARARKELDDGLESAQGDAADRKIADAVRALLD